MLLFEESPTRIFLNLDPVNIWNGYQSKGGSISFTICYNVVLHRSHKIFHSNRMSKEVPFTATFLAVKLLDIGLITVYFFVLGTLAAKGFDLLFGELDHKKYRNRPLWLLFIEIILHLFLLGVVAYALRNTVGLIPYPLDGVAGYNHFRLKELEGGEVMALVLVLFQKNLRTKLLYFVNRAFGISVNNIESNESRN